MAVREVRLARRNRKGRSTAGFSMFLYVCLCSGTWGWAR